MAGRAIGKLILLGEHFVVYGSPALALPLPAVSTTVRLEPGGPALELDPGAPEGSEALAWKMLAELRGRLGCEEARWRILVESTNLIGHGLGSSASFAVALVRAVLAALGREASPDEINAHAFALERIVHGTPSGIDNTVISFERPIWFVRGAGPELLEWPGGLRFVLGSSGHPGSTREAVAEVRARREADPGAFEALLRRAREIAQAGCAAFTGGQADRLGPLLSESHELLRTLGVSTPRLDALVAAARAAGALGAKLTGAGRGGFMVALVEEKTEAAVLGALSAAGAARTLSACGTPRP